MSKKAYFLCSFIICFVGFIASLTVELPECDPPAFPSRGGYGPIQEYYVVGDSIHYFCENDAYIGGNYYRRCEDNGDWTGDTPVCDGSTNIQLVNQTTTAQPEVDNNASLALDGIRSTCSLTDGGHDQYWMAIFKDPGELIRVMVFMPQGEVAYEVLLLKNDGSVLSCGSKRDANGRLGWEFHNCPGPNNRDAIGVKIVSLSPKPLEICEIAAHVLISPTCVDPHLHVDDGQIQLTRQTASLVCNKGFTRSPVSKIECVRDGVWNRKRLYCLERQWTEDIERERVQHQPPANDP
ncbi:uncharacterized protein [Parasteatoda tepidariorum]|uniref:uncharacterized protein n=1 Tax=Parasteatoda tepidariorum TaxID=114398 RepID=UPI00077F9B96|nr:uncharacterized protein LOC107454002 [Parasteatoda tepidariorum]